MNLVLMSCFGKGLDGILKIMGIEGNTKGYWKNKKNSSQIASDK